MTTIESYPVQQAAPSIADLFRALGVAFVETADRLSAVPTPAAPDVAKVRPPGPVTHSVRMGLHYRLLSALMAAGGSMPKAAFAKAAHDVGYGRGYAQFYSKKDGLCVLTDGAVIMTTKGKNRLDYARGFLGITGPG